MLRESKANCEEVPSRFSLVDDVWSDVLMNKESNATVSDLCFVIKVKAGVVLSFVLVLAKVLELLVGKSSFAICNNVVGFRCEFVQN